MPDRPEETNNPKSDQPAKESSWHKPQTSGDWRVPEANPPKEEKPKGWRRVALPANLQQAPTDEGAWHLPRPEDTVYAPEEGQPTTVDMPFPGSIEPLQADLEETTAPDDDFDTFSMSELVALASLVDETPPTETMPGIKSVSAPSAPAVEDPAEYARRQLEQLSQGEAAPAPATSTPSAEDPAEYARRQLEALGISAPSAPAQTPPAAQAQPALSPADMELAAKFRDTEEQVRSLRRMFGSGQITREQLQAQLRQLMVLDNNQVWWMMGVETDTWYRFENNQWLAATPPVLAAEQPRKAAPPTITGQMDPQQVIQGSLPYLPSEPVAQPGATERSAPQPGVEDMPLPRAVPIHDPDYTVPSPGGVYLETIRQSEAPTLAATQPASAVTVPSTPVVEAPQSPVVSTPYDTTEPPSYDLEKEAPYYDEAMKRHQRTLVSTIIKLALVGVALMFVLFACSLGGLALYYQSIAGPWQDEIAALANYQPEFQTARILDARGQLIAELTSQQGGRRTKIDLSEVSPFMVHAVVSLENERFFDDPGWDPIAIGRAFLQNLGSGETTSGASTITQQIARQLILHDTTVSADRKINEIVIAAGIGQQYDKNFILNLYLNEIYFGNQSYGVEAAAQFYFDKSAADLNLAESALLAGVIQSPATLDPLVNRDAAMQRMRTVIVQMADVGCLQFQHAPYLGQPFCIDQQQVVVRDGEVVGGQALVEMAQVEITEFRPRPMTIRYPHFVNFVQAQLEQTFGTTEIFRRGFTVQTTLDPRIQDAAQNALVRQMAALVNTGVNTGSVMVTDPRDGAILAMIGSPDFNNVDIDGQVNNAFSWQQPGSSIKPVVYTAALEGVDRNGNGQLEYNEYLTPASILWDVPTFYAESNYRPVNYDRQFHGPQPMRYALQNSYNIPAIKAYEFTCGTPCTRNDRFIDTATRMGFSFLDEAQFGLPTGVGATEVRLFDMMEAYGTLANNGNYVPLYSIVSITDADGNAVPLTERPAPAQVVQPQIAYLMQNVLSDNQARAAAFGTNSGLTIPALPPLNFVGAKTGTSNDSRDLWTLGFTTNAVGGVWIGRPDNAPTAGTSGLAAVPIWNETMTTALAVAQQDGDVAQQFNPPGGIIPMQICADTGTLPGENCTSVRNEVFLQSQPPPPADQALVQTVAIDTWTGLRANEFCPDNVITATFANISDPYAIEWLNNTPQGQAEAQRLGLPIPVQQPSTGACDLNTQFPIVRLIQPTDNQTVQGRIQVTGAVSAPTSFNRYQLEVAAATAPDSFTIVDGPYTNQQAVAGSVLGNWDTTSFPNGTYILRLAVFANDGGYVFRAATVNVNNPQPTPIPPPTAIPTVPDFGATPLPFDTVVPQFGPTPTATISFNG